MSPQETMMNRRDGDDLPRLRQPGCIAGILESAHECRQVLRRWRDMQAHGDRARSQPPHGAMAQLGLRSRHIRTSAQRKRPSLAAVSVAAPVSPSVGPDERKLSNPSTGAHRCLMTRCSSSTTLSRDRCALASTLCQRHSSSPGNHRPRCVAGFPSATFLPGHGTPSWLTGMRKNACAASMPRSLQSSDAADVPRRSTAR